jgi:hypothetical protein
MTTVDNDTHVNGAGIVQFPDHFNLYYINADPDPYTLTASQPHCDHSGRRDVATKTISRAGVHKIGTNANLVNKGIKDINAVSGKLLPKIGELSVASVERGGKTLLRTKEMVHTAQSGAAVIADATVETVKQGAITVGKWEAQPYIDNAKDSAMRTFQNAVSGR